MPQGTLVASCEHSTLCTGTVRLPALLIRDSPLTPLHRALSHCSLCATALSHIAQ